MPAHPPLTIVAVDNQQVVLAGLKSLAFSHAEIVRSVTTFEQVVDIDVSGPPPDVVILDYWLGRDDHECLDAIAALTHWGSRVILYTSEEKPIPLQRAARAGVDAVCLKNDGLQPLVDALVSVSTGQPVLTGALARAIGASPVTHLTPAEQRVLNGLAYGLSTAEIAARLVVAESTVAAHEKKIHHKYRDAFQSERMTRARVLFESLRDGYWDTRTDFREP